MNEATRALEQIRRTELEAAQHVEEARARANEIETEARAQVRRIVEEGRERGRLAARQRLDAALEGAGTEAAAIRARGESEARVLGESAEGPMDQLIAEMVRVVLAPPSEPGK
jgi:vacuolar-type H+-ATPase subunit H